MKKILLLFSIALIFCSCSKSPEDKANELIKAELRKSLYKPDSYKPIETKLDSAFTPYDNPALFEKMEELVGMGDELNDLNRNLKRAKSSMSIWNSPYMSSFGRNEYNEAKEEYENANSRIEKLKEKGQKKFEEVVSLLVKQPQFIGYLATHNYRADNNAGNTLIGNSVFIIDKDFKEVLFSCEVEEYNQIQKTIKQFEEQFEEQIRAYK
jgi:PBP1b-binding outer membrane lipoprotein LpoB